VSPALNQLEANVVRWLCQIMGYPGEARGFLTSGGSLANWSGLVTARHGKRVEDFLRGCHPGRTALSPSGCSAG